MLQPTRRRTATPDARRLHKKARWGRRFARARQVQLQLTHLK